MDDVEIDCLIIGAGIIGSALSVQIKRKFPNKEVVVVEAGPRPGEGITSRNSGVIHSGIYYPPNSLKASTCIRGLRLLYDWCQSYNVPFKKCGKLIVSKKQVQNEILLKLFQNGQDSGAPDLEILEKSQIPAREENINGEMAIWAPWTGIVDSAALCQSFLQFAIEKGTVTLYNSPVKAIERQNSQYRVEAGQEIISANTVINAAGLNSDEIAKMVGIHKYKIYHCRGDYFYIKTQRKFKTLVYPVKDPMAPNLGVHLTLGLDGRYRLGPDAEYVEQKNYFSPRVEKESVFREAAKILFEFDDFDLQYDTCGIRPKLRSPDEKAEKDFVIAEDLPGFFNLMGIESPGLTASLAIGELVCKQLNL